MYFPIILGWPARPPGNTRSPGQGAGLTVNGVHRGAGTAPTVHSLRHHHSDMSSSATWARLLGGAPAVVCRLR